MSTSGVSDLGHTARDIITFAYRKINVVPASREPSAEQAEKGRIELSLLLKELQKHTQLWRRSTMSVTLTDATQSYSLSPIPRRIVSARLRSGTRDTPMRRMTADEYDDLPMKSAPGQPTSFFYDLRRTAGTLYVWPVLATSASQTIELTYQRRIEVVTDISEDIDIHEDYMPVVGYLLAGRLADDLNIEGSQRIVVRAESMLADVLDADRPEEYQFMAGSD